MGFVEGDGSFSYTKSRDTFAFIITQKGNRALLQAIQDFLYKFAQAKSLLNNDAVLINPQGVGHKFHLVVNQLNFIEQIIIPFFHDLSFHSKKYLDFVD